MNRTLTTYPELLDVATVAQILNVTTKTVRRHIENNDIPAIKIGRLYRIPSEWLDAFLQAK